MRNSSYWMIFRDLLGGAKQKSEGDELTLELLAEMTLVKESGEKVGQDGSPPLKGMDIGFIKPVLKAKV